MSAAPIPYVFHFVFGLREQTEPFHLMYYLCLASCIGVNRPDAVHFHYRNEPYGPWWERIKPHLTLRRIDPERFVEGYEYADSSLAAFRYAHLADFARLQILLDEGGIYADIDTLFLRPIPRQWLQHDCILGREKVIEGAGQDGSLCNAWIAAKPGSAFCRLWLDNLAGAFDGSWSNHSTLLPYRLAMANPDLIHVEPETSFFALDWTPERIDDLLLRRVELPEHAYSLHLWNHLWFAEDRLDFSRFHGDLLTPDYVAFADTTYAVNARPFLPEDVPVSRVRYWRMALRNALQHPRAVLRSVLRLVLAR